MSEARNARQRRWNEANRDRVATINRRSQLKTKYGMTPEEYDELLAKQKGRCAICGREPEEGKRLVVDHDHVTGMYRELLCTRCNTALGMLEEDQTRMRALVRYVEKYQWRRSVFDVLKAG